MGFVQMIFQWARQQRRPEVAARALKVGDTVIQLTDAVAVRKAAEDSVWFVTSSVAVRAKMTMDEACKLLDWKIAKTVDPAT